MLRCYLFAYLPNVERTCTAAPRTHSRQPFLAYVIHIPPDLVRAKLRTRHPYCVLTVRTQVFAYLPTREYGLRFMVNADFIVTTSRYGSASNVCTCHDPTPSSRTPSFVTKTLPYALVVRVHVHKRGM